MKNPENIVYQNTSSHETFSKVSFICILHEQEKWNQKAYWALDSALFGIAAKYQNDQMPRELILAIFDLHEYTFGRLCWHQIPSDGSSIENLSADECFQYLERITNLVRAALGGYSINNQEFDLVNPNL